MAFNLMSSRAQEKDSMDSTELTLRDRHRKKLQARSYNVSIKKEQSFDSVKQRLESINNCMDEMCSEFKKMIVSENQFQRDLQTKYDRILKEPKFSSHNSSQPFDISVDEIIDSYSTIHGLFKEVITSPRLSRPVSLQSSISNFSLEDSQSELDNALETALENKLNNRGLYHNLENPQYPDWAPKLVHEIYIPTIRRINDIHQQYQQADQVKVVPDNHDWVCVINYKVPRKHDIKTRNRRLKFIVTTQDLPSMSPTQDYHPRTTVRFSPTVQICTFPYHDIVSKHEALEPHDDFPDIVELFTIDETEDSEYDWSNTRAYIDPPKSILKPVSPPKFGDLDSYLEPIKIGKSTEHKRYAKNIPRLIEFGAYSESKLGIKLNKPDGY